MAFNDLITYEATGADGVTYRITAGSDSQTRWPGGAPINETNAQTPESTSEPAQEPTAPEPAVVAPPAAQERDTEDRAQRALDALRSVRGVRRGGAQTPQE